MFARPVTLIVGAGASAEFSFPVGEELKSQIATKLNFSDDGFRGVAGGDPTIWDAIKISAKRHNSPTQKLNEHFQASRIISRAMPQALSIDNYIDAHRANDSIEMCGKLAIGSAILRAERRCSLYLENTDDTSAKIMSRTTNTWLAAVQALAFQQSYRSEVNRCLDNLNIITFNYDRCIELFLFHAIKNYFHVQDDIAAAIVNKLSVVHVYGSLGDLPWQNSNGIHVPFGEEPHGETLLSISTRLKTFTESASDRPEKAVIEEMIRNSEVIVFLGCGFHDQNIEILNIKNVSQNDARKTVLGTAKSISESNANAIRKKLLSGLNWKIDDGPTLRRDLLCSQIIWEYQRIIVGG